MFAGKEMWAHRVLWTIHGLHFLSIVVGRWSWAQITCTMTSSLSDQPSGELAKPSIPQMRACEQEHAREGRVHLTLDLLYGLELLNNTDWKCFSSQCIRIYHTEQFSFLYLIITSAHSMKRHDTSNYIENLPSCYPDLHSLTYAILLILLVFESGSLGQAGLNSL